MFKISIPKPCHEDWDAMTPNEQGRHCNVCVKTVVDFTAMTDEQVQNYFINKKSESTCGRFRGDQLGRITITLPHNVFEIRIARWKKFLAACLLFFSTLLFSCNTQMGEPVEKITGQMNVLDSKKTDTLPSPHGYVGGLALQWDSTITLKEPQCSVTFGVSVYEDATFISDVDTAGNVIPTVLTGDTIVAETPDTTEHAIDSTFEKEISNPDSSSCNNENFINL